jgi:tetratricopeptide (TPR) repeat protein
MSAIGSPRSAGSRERAIRSRRLWQSLVLGGIALGLWAWWGSIEDRRGQEALAAAQREMESGHHAMARQRLQHLIRGHRFRDEAYYRLGLCEEARGRFDLAMAMWEEVSAASPFAVKAAIARAQVLTNSGKFTQVEELLDTIPWRQQPESRQVRQSLELLLLLEGRPDEVLRLILELWQGSDSPVDVLRQVYQLDNAVFPVDYVRSALSAADPYDGRVCLGKANLAMWLGRFDEAAGWLDKALARRPDDPVCWRIRLDLAIATNDLDSFRRAASRLSLGRLTSREVLRFRAWIVARLGDFDAERSALRSLVDDEPGNIGAWDRLAELAIERGSPAEATGYRKTRAELNDLRERYKGLMARDDRASHAEELESLAARLGRKLEARGWSQVRRGIAGRAPLMLGEDLADGGGKMPGTLETLLADLLSRPAASPSHARPMVQPSQVTFSDDAGTAGLHFVHDNGHSGERTPPPTEAMCGGVALLDFDRDGWLDAYVVQGGPFPPTGSTEKEGGDRLFRNRGDGSFEDVTERSGIARMPRGYGHGVTVADYDNDGWTDLFVTRWQGYALCRNKGDGTFEDVTSQAGLTGLRDWPTSAAFADLDGDGDLDLYVCHYLLYDPSKPKRCEHTEAPSQHACYPKDFPSLPDHVFRNDGGRFVDMTDEAGFVDPDGRGLGVVAADFDDDGLIDLYVANDMTANYFFRNKGGFRFEETGQASGAAASVDGGFKAGMGVACGDLDGDGRPDLAVTNFFGESTTFYRNLGGGSFADHSNAIGLAAATRRLLGFGVAFLDVDNDGWLDVLSANGHILDRRPRYPWDMPLQLLLGGPGGRLTDVSESSGAPFRPLHLGRGLAFGDLDNDGLEDALVVAQNEPLIYLHNRTTEKRHSIRFRLEGTKSNRDAIGAKVTIACAGRDRIGLRIGGGSYQSSGDPRIHFGLGAATRVDRVEVRWPSGRVDRHPGLDADRDYLLREGERPVER